MVIVGGVKKESGHLIDGKIINNKILLHTAQWYITHTCNLSCKHCLSHNNFAINGHDEFYKNIEYAKKWNELVTIKDFTIVGGEVFTHNDLDTWVHGLRDVFEDVPNFKVITNGTLLEKYAASFDSWFEKNIVLEVSLKRKQDIENFYEFIKRFKYAIQKHYLYDCAIYIDDKLCFLVEHCPEHRPWAIKEKVNNFHIHIEIKGWQSVEKHFFFGEGVSVLSIIDNVVFYALYTNLPFP